MSTKLVLDFTTADGGTARFNYNYCDPEVSTANIKTLMQTMITNGSVFSKPPLAQKAAKLVTTTETTLDLS